MNNLRYQTVINKLLIIDKLSKINRPMYNTRPKFESRKFKKISKLNYCACNHATQKQEIHSNDILQCNIVLIYLLILLIFIFIVNETQFKFLLFIVVGRHFLLFSPIKVRSSNLKKNYKITKPKYNTHPQLLLIFSVKKCVLYSKFYDKLLSIVIGGCNILSIVIGKLFIVIGSYW